MLAASGRHPSPEPTIMSPFQPEPVVLEGATVRLEPLTPAHAGDLLEHALDPDLWRWTLGHIESRADLERYIAHALEEQARERALPFAHVLKATGRAIGSTRFGSIERAHRRVEIGWTWIGRAHQRTAVNTEAKYLMLRHAFETWECLRVELKTNALNTRSRDAMLRIGCVEEGVLRQHAISDRGVVRDTLYLSVLQREWPAVKARLERRLREGAVRPARGGAPESGADR
jgi:N-acetyltransferase